MFQFAQKELAPKADEIDKTNSFPGMKVRNRKYLISSLTTKKQGWQKGGKYSYFPGRPEILVIPGNYWEISPYPIRKF